MDDAVRALAKAAGVAVDWIDAADQPQRVSIGSLRRVLDGLGYPAHVFWAGGGQDTFP